LSWHHPSGRPSRSLFPFAPFRGLNSSGCGEAKRNSALWAIRNWSQLPHSRRVMELSRNNCGNSDTTMRHLRSARNTFSVARPNRALTTTALHLHLLSATPKKLTTSHLPPSSPPPLAFQKNQRFLRINMHADPKSLHEFTVENIRGETFDFSQLKGKVGIFQFPFDNSKNKTKNTGGPHRQCGLPMRLHTTVQGPPGAL